MQAQKLDKNMPTLLQILKDLEIQSNTQ